MWKLVILAANMQLQTTELPTKEACLAIINSAHPSVQRYASCVNMQPNVTETYSGVNVMKQRGEK